ncbi:MAG: PTS sugar transporter subunit IIA [Leptospirales bacterium]|nr:PTS sugar transporter subunit IIA [Leptospirales bacterium]
MNLFVKTAVKKLECNLMVLADTLKKNNILVGANFKEPAALFGELLNLAVKNGEIQPDDLKTIRSALITREKSMTTGIGHGLAIPHCVSPKIKKPLIMLATISGGMDFTAIDDKPVYVAVLLVFPEDKMSAHVKLLANIAQMMSKSEFMEKLISLKSSSGILKAIKNYKHGE